MSLHISPVRRVYIQTLPFLNARENKKQQTSSLICFFLSFLAEVKNCMVTIEDILTVSYIIYQHVTLKSRSHAS